MSIDSNFKEDPKGFMEDNIVIPALPSGDLLGSMGVDADGCVDVYVRESATKKDARGDRKVCEMYLAKGKPVATLKIYWCPYDNNQIKGAILGTKAKYMFTSGMNMCTFGVKHQPDGSCHVAHANSVGGVIGLGKTSGGNIAQMQRQVDMVKRQLGDTADVLEPDTYMADQGGASFVWCSTTFGRLEGSAWKFYILKWMRLGTTVNQLYVHGGLEQGRFA